KPGNVTDRNLQGAGTGKAAGLSGLDRTTETVSNLQGAGPHKAGAGEAGATGNKLKTGNQGTRGNMGGNQAKMHTGKMAGAGGAAGGPHTINQQMPHHLQIG